MDANEMMTSGDVIPKRRSEVFDAAQLARLRALVACMQCGAVPTDTGKLRVNPFTGEPTDLPLVVTTHAEWCAVGKTPEGRAPRLPRRGPGWKHKYVAGPPCEWCTKEMEVPARQVGKQQLHWTKRFCSPNCRSYAAKERKRAERLNTTTCLTCNRDFQQSGTRQRYCGRSCRYRYNRWMKVHGGPPPLPETRPCAEVQCTKDFTTTDPTKKFCSVRCRHRASDRRRFGPKGVA